MKVFHCNHCNNLVFFESFRCVVCDHPLAFLPDLGTTASLEQAADGSWRSPLVRCWRRRPKSIRSRKPEWHAEVAACDTGHAVPSLRASILHSTAALPPRAAKGEMEMSEPWGF